MTLAALLRHTLVIERSSGTPALDGYHQPVPEWAPLATVRGLIQPRTEREAENQGQGGATVTDAVVYLLPTDVLPRDRVRREDQPDGPWYELTGVRDAAGQGRHLECDARLVA